MPIVGGTTRQDQIAYYAGLLEQQAPASPDSAGKIIDIGKDYIAYMAKHPDLSPKVVYDTITARITLLTGIPSGIGKAIGGALGATAQTAVDTGSSVTAAYPAWLQGFLGNNGILRIAEGVIGIVIVAVSLDKLMGGNAGPASVLVKGLKLK